MTSPWRGAPPHGNPGPIEITDTSIFHHIAGQGVQGTGLHEGFRQHSIKGPEGQEDPGGPRRSQGEPGGARRSQEEPGGARRGQEFMSGAIARRSQEGLGGAMRQFLIGSGIREIR